jgi:hypothetical protein
LALRSLSPRSLGYIAVQNRSLARMYRQYAVEMPNPRIGHLEEMVVTIRLGGKGSAARRE